MGKLNLEAADREFDNIKTTLEDIKRWNRDHDQKDDERHDDNIKRHEETANRLTEFRSVVESLMTVEDRVRVLEKRNAQDKPWLDIIREIGKAFVIKALWFLIGAAAVAAGLRMFSRE